MIRFHRSLMIAAAGALMLTTTVASAQATRPGSSVPMVSKAVTEKMGTRASKRVKAEERLTGTSLVLVVLAAVGASVVAIAAISKKNDSRG
jgi:hypothetical protein